MPTTYTSVRSLYRRIARDLTAGVSRICGECHRRIGSAGPVPECAYDCPRVAHLMRPLRRLKSTF